MLFDDRTRPDAAPLPVGPAAREVCPRAWVQVSWDELAACCRRLADQLCGPDQPEVVLALARAGYVPGAILASLLRCDLVTLRVHPAGDRVRPEAERSAAAWLRPRLGGRRVLVLDETSRTGESLAWAARAAAGAGAAAVRTAALFLTPESPRPDFCAATTDAHLLQPWLRDCVGPFPT